MRKAGQLANGVVGKNESQWTVNAQTGNLRHNKRQKQQYNKFGYGSLPA